MTAKNKKKLVAAAAGVVLLFGIPLLVYGYYNARSPGRSQAVAGLRVAVERISNAAATPGFKFTSVPPPFKPNAATQGKFSLLTGQRDGNSARLGRFQNGGLPDGPDAPNQNFFFSDGSIGGRILVDLEQPKDIQQINTYSWHVSDRGPQRYNLYAYADTAEDASPTAVGSDDPLKFGWLLLAKVDTRPKPGTPGGQYGVSISAPAGVIGHYRYLLFDCRRTESDDRWGNTFYSEIDVIAK